MNDTKPDDKVEEARIGRVLQAAGRRVQPSEDVARSVREAAHSEWMAIVNERRRKQRRYVGLAAAASIVAIAVAAWVGRSTVAPPPVTVASITKVTGDVRVQGGWGRSHAAAANQPLRSGERLITGRGGRVALALATGVSVRLDHDTEIEFSDAHQAVLETGAAYVDSPGEPVAERRLRIETPIGAVQHFGTQYEVKFVSPALRLRVREGRVALTPDEGILLSGNAGEQLTVAADGQVHRMPIQTHGTEWSWASELAPTLDIDGRTLTDFLSWASRELGQPVVFANAESEAEAAKVILSGSVTGLVPKDALAAVLSTTRLRNLDSDGRIVISLAY